MSTRARRSLHLVDIAGVGAEDHVVVATTPFGRHAFAVGSARPRRRSMADALRWRARRVAYLPERVAA